MAKVLRYTGLFFVTLVLAAGTSVAAFDAYLRIPNRLGDSPNALHPGAQGWIEIKTISWGAAHRPMMAGLPPGPGRVTVTSASPQLLRLCTTGQHFLRFDFDVHGRRVILDNVKVLSVSQIPRKIDSPVRLPLESISFAYGRAER